MRLLVVEDEKSLSKALVTILIKTDILRTRFMTERRRWNI